MDRPNASRARMSPPRAAGVVSNSFQVVPPSWVNRIVPASPATRPLLGSLNRTARRLTVVGVRYWLDQRGGVGGRVTLGFFFPPPPQLGARRQRRIRLPIDLLFTAPHVLHPGQHEQQVRKSVHILDDDGWHGDLAGQEHDAPL